MKPIRAIVGFAPGGATDIMARALAQKLTDTFGQQIIVDNRAGGGGIIAATMAKESPPDGYTVFFGTISTLATNVATNPKLPYDPLQDFAPITMTSYNPYFLVVHPSVPAKSVKEFVVLARAKPGQLNYASSGPEGARISRSSFSAPWPNSIWCTFRTKDRRRRSSISSAGRST
jgi:tripartite-type tricarboxylate transporter receptor subunit TctC